MSLKVVVADANDASRQAFCRLVTLDPEAEVVGDCWDVRSGLDAVRHSRPDAIFWDAQLREEPRAADPRIAPFVILVANSEGHVRAATGPLPGTYVLRPPDRIAVQDALEKAKAHRDRALLADLAGAVGSLLENFGGSSRRRKWVLVRDGEESRFLRLRDIDWLEADHNHVRLHVGTNVYPVRESLASFERELEPEQFLRIHRSTIVNIERVRSIQPWFGGRSIVILRDGSRLTMSAGYQGRIRPYRLLGS